MINFIQMDEDTQVTFILLEEDGVFAAQGLQRDIVGQGDTPEEAFEDFSKTYDAEMRLLGRERFLKIPPAPEYYQNLAKKGVGFECIHKIDER